MMCSRAGTQCIRRLVKGAAGISPPPRVRGLSRAEIVIARQGNEKQSFAAVTHKKFVTVGHKAPLNESTEFPRST
jgi:hypothetical protein